MAGTHFNAYIDESGDEGFTTPEKHGQGSKEWLVLAGIIVPGEDDHSASGAADRLRSLLGKPPPKPLHFRDLKHSGRRAAMQQLADEDFTFSVVAIHKPGITSSFLRTPPYLYNYAARFLVERLSWYADDHGRKLNLYFENRSATSYADLQGYMTWIQNDPACQIRADTIDQFKPVNATVKLAQIADFYASASAAALEPDKFGNPTEDYLLRVRHQLYRMPDKPVLSYGFKVFPTIDEGRYPWIVSL